jgi:hypothetical protein
MDVKWKSELQIANMNNLKSLAWVFLVEKERNLIKLIIASSRG